MNMTFECHDALDVLQPREKRDVVSTFGCAGAGNYVLGVWVRGEGTQVIPLYLTQEQLNNVEAE